VITAVGFLNRPNLPAFAGLDEFRGPSWHSARWPQNFDLRGKRIAVVGTGATGYQMIPDIALQAEHVTVFQRTPQWVFGIPGYRSPFPPQVSWLDRNLPLHTNFMRFRSSYGGPAFGEIMTIDPEFDDPHAVSAGNKRARDACMAFLTSKVSDPELIAKMTPEHPVWSARAIMVDSDYSILYAIQRDNVSLVASEVKRVDRTGIEAEDGSRHEVDAIVFATGFHATEYLYPMTITGRGGMTTAKLWEKDGARAYQGCMMPGFPNLWSIYGPNTNGSLNVASFHELIALNALLGMQHLILEGKRAIDVKEDAYWTYNHRLDAENGRKVWSDPRASNYYWTKFGRSAVQNPLSGVEMWQRLRKLNFDDLIVD
jgi:4-hydroxyacetophenone monooxygenase